MYFSRSAVRVRLLERVYDGSRGSGGGDNDLSLSWDNMLREKGFLLT